MYDDFANTEGIRLTGSSICARTDNGRHKVTYPYAGSNHQALAAKVARIFTNPNQEPVDVSWDSVESDGRQAIEVTWDERAAPLQSEFRFVGGDCFDMSLAALFDHVDTADGTGPWEVEEWATRPVRTFLNPLVVLDHLYAALMEVNPDDSLIRTELGTLEVIEKATELVDVVADGLGDLDPMHQVATHTVVLVDGKPTITNEEN